MERGGVCSVAVAAMVLAMAVMAPEAAEQAQPPACAAKLFDCREFISSTATASTPSTTCCFTIKELAENELACLCGVLTNTALLEGLKFDVAQAMDVPMRCGIAAAPSLCKYAVKAPSSPPEAGASGLAEDGAVMGAAAGEEGGGNAAPALESSLPKGPVIPPGHSDCHTPGIPSFGFCPPPPRP